MDWHSWILLFLQVSEVVLLKNAAGLKERKKQQLSFFQHSKCTYSYEVAVHTARGSKSTESDGFQVHALIDVTSVAREHEGRSPLHLYKLDVREPRLRRVLYGRVLNNYPVNEEFEEQLSKPFYFRQKEHGTVVDVLFPKAKESPEVAAFKKGIAGSFQLDLRKAHKFNIYEVQENDDSGIFRTKYSVVSANDTHAHLHRTWTNLNYQLFADGSPGKGEDKIQSQHSAHVHLKTGIVEKVHRTMSAFLTPTKGHPRAENFKDFRRQDVEMSASGYSKLTLRSCSGPEHQRSKRSTVEIDEMNTIKHLTRDSLLFDNTEKIKWVEIGGEKKKTRPMHELLRCFVEKNVKEREIGYCTNELHFLVRYDESVFREIKRLVQNRNHQNLTSWAVYLAALVAHGKYEAQNILAHAVMTSVPRPLSNEEYLVLLVSIHYLPDGPLHCSLFNALFKLAMENENGQDVSATAMLVLAGLTERAKRAGYNDTLSKSVAEVIYHRYSNRSSLYHSDSEEYESHLRDHIWAFGNLGDNSGLPVILRHIDHDNSDIRSAVVSATRKLSPKHTNEHLMRALYQDEHNEVKAAVVNVFIDRHQDLTESIVQGLEHALWCSTKGDILDSSIKEFLENHGNHTKAVYLRIKRKLLHRRKRALIPELRPREYELGRSKRWNNVVGGEWLGAETILQFTNKLHLRIGIFGGKVEVILDNLAIIRAHALKFPFEIASGKAVFKASASFKNDFPKDLIHFVSDIGDELLRNFDDIMSVIAKGINAFRKKLIGYVPLKITRFTDFVTKFSQFLNNIALPLQALEGTDKVINFSKDLKVRVKEWASLMERIKKIQQSLAKLNGFETLFKKVRATLDEILGLFDGISKNLPKHLPTGFNIKHLLQTLRKVPVSQQAAEVERYFKLLGSSAADGFRLVSQLKFSIHFSSSLEMLQDLLVRLQHSSSNFLKMFYLLDSLEGTKLPALNLPILKRHSPTFQGQIFNFGLDFDWRASVNFKINLKSVDFQKFLVLLRDFGDFFSPFTLFSFDLETFFQDILPGGKYDKQIHSSELYKVNHNNRSDPSDVLQGFLFAMADKLELYTPNISTISHIADFFQELGPELTKFTEQGLQKFCRLQKEALNLFDEFTYFGEKIETKEIHILKEVQNATKKVLVELETVTMDINTSINAIERNFTASIKIIASESLQQITSKLRDIQNLADTVKNFTQGTSSKISGACTKIATFSADIIDKVQTKARQTVNDLAKKVEPMAATIKNVGSLLKDAATKVETWYEENLAAGVGKVSFVSRIITDFLSVVNTKDMFLDTVRDISSRLSTVLKQLRSLPEYALRARKTIDGITQFVNEARNYKEEVKKLDIRKQFGIDFDQQIKNVCSEFNKIITSPTLGKVKTSHVVQDLNTFFNKEANMYIDEVLPKFRGMRDSVDAIRRGLPVINDMASDVMEVLKELKPLTKSFLPVIEKARNLPDCQEMTQLFLHSTKPCIQEVLKLGGFIIDQYNDLKNEIIVLSELVPETWKNFRIQNCFRAVNCISKSFIEQGKVIRNKMNSIKDKLAKASEWTGLLSVCEKGVNNITEVLDAVNLLMEQVKTLSLQNNFQRAKTVLQKITGQKKRTRGQEGENDDQKEIVNYIQKAKEVDEQVRYFHENTFQVMHSIYINIFNRATSVNKMRSSLDLVHRLWEKTKDSNPALKSVENGANTALQFADNVQVVVDLFFSPAFNLLKDLKFLCDVIKPVLDKDVVEVTEVIDKVNGFAAGVTDFLSKIQTRQRGLEPSAYKPWYDIPYCSEDVCLRSIRRSSPLYLSTIFTWKFPHLDDLSSMQKSGRWLTPGLFDDYKVEGISQLSENEMILGMYGVASNADRASLLVVTNVDRGVKKIVQLTKKGNILSVRIGGVAVAKDYIWISNSDKNEILSVRKEDIKATFSSPKPSQVDIIKSVDVEGTAGSVSYDEKSNVLWVVDGKEGKAYGYGLSLHGDLTIPGRVINIGKNAQGMIIVRQFGKEYACISRCALIAGFQCKLEFHNLTRGDETGENTLARVVRTPSGLESVTRVDNEIIALAFSSGTIAEKENIELVGGDFEDRYFKIRLPILHTGFGIYENCLYFKLLGNYILPPMSIFPLEKRICGTKRKRSISQELLETDVYHAKLEDIHENRKRVRRNAQATGPCLSLLNTTLLKGSHDFFQYSDVILVFGIPVKFFAGASGHFQVGYQGKFCLEKKVFTLGLIPGAWISVSAGASVPLLLIEAGITIEARLLETKLIPELSLTFAKWPLKACVQLKLQMTPLSIRVYMWYRFLIPTLKCWILGCKRDDRWSSKSTFKEWWWSAREIDRILFTSCKKNSDTTPPMPGTCTARQVADTKYFVQWNGFKEDKKISSYQVRVGPIEGSDDEYSSWQGTSLSHLVTNLHIKHGRDVFVSVLARNDEERYSPLAYCPLIQARRKGPEIRYLFDGGLQQRDVDYQSDANYLAMNFDFNSDFSEIVDLKWGVSSSAACTFDESEADVVSLTSLGDSNYVQVSGLNLGHGRKYFIRLYAMDKFGLKNIVCSDGILIDKTPPIPTHFHDGAGENDASFLPSLRRVRGKFDHFIDPESPVVKYEWKIVGNISDEDVTAFVNIPLTQQTPLIDGLSLKAGDSYRLVLRGTNAAGLQAVIETNGFIPDDTPPDCGGYVIDVSDKTEKLDVDFVQDLECIQAKWNCFDRESGIRSQLLGVGTYPGGDNIRPFNEMSPEITIEDVMFYAKFHNITISEKIRYHVTVKVINGAGLKKTIFSDGILIDKTPPTVAALYIKDGKDRRDNEYSSDRFSFSANWKQAFSDTESGLAEYRVGLGTRPGLADIKAFTKVGSQTNVTLTGILLESGQRYFVTVVGCNRVGMCVNGSSNGAIIDFVPPHHGKVITGLSGPPVLYQWINKSVWARWNWCLADKKRLNIMLNYSDCSSDSFYDVHSGIYMFSISVFSQSTAQFLAPFKLAGRQGYSGRNIDLKDGIYSVAIEASDKAGITARGLSNTFIVDTTPPLIMLVQHGHYGEALAYLNTPSVTFRSYFVLEDDLSKVKAYKVGVGSYSGADDIIKFQFFTLRFPISSLQANWSSAKVTPLKNNHHYFITVVALNNAGLFTIKSSPPLLSDFEAPINGVVLDGWGLHDAEYQSFTSLYRAHWYGFTDISGIEKVYLGLSSKSRSTVCDVQQEEIVSSNTNFHVLYGLALIPGQKYYACFKVVDRAGNFAFFQSNGVVVDASPPRPGYVADGRPGQEIEIQIENSVLRASWGNFTESETKIVSYQLAFGSFPGGQDVQLLTNVGNVNTSTSSKLKVSELTNGRRYYATVIALNILGMYSPMVSSDGVTVDTTPPFFLEVIRDGDDPRNDFSYTNESSLKATWKCEDTESGLATIEIAFGLQPGEADIIHFTSLPVSKTSFMTNCKLQQGVRYFATVRCKNQVGLTAASFSDGIVYDGTPPNLVYVRDGDYQAKNRTLFVTFKFVDAESSIQAYKVQVFREGSYNGSVYIYGSFSFNANVTEANLELSKELDSGNTYYVNVTAVNHVGLEATEQSNGFVVDTTPPICSKVWDGKGNYEDDIEYASMSHRFVISWFCYDIESPIVRSRLSVKDVETNVYYIPFYTLTTPFNTSGSEIITGEGRMTTKIEDGNNYVSGIEVVNAVGLATVTWTNGVVIDSTPPKVINLALQLIPKADYIKAAWLVSDNESGVKSLFWGLGTTAETNDIKNFTEVSPLITNISVSSVSFQQGSTCFLNIFAVNNGGLSSKSSSDAIVVDRSAPNPGIVVASYVFPRNYDQSKTKVPNSTFLVRWTGFNDPESGIKETKWAVGTDCQNLKQDSSKFYTEISPYESVGGVIIENQTLVENETYCVCIRVTNGAGLYTTDCSPGMFVVLGKLSAGVVSDGPITSANDIDFQLDNRAIWAHWHGFEDRVFGIVKYDCCLRDLPPNPTSSDLCTWPLTDVRNSKRKAGRFHNLTLLHGRKYYITVKAENKRGDTVMSSSDGVVIDRTPPIGKSLQILSSLGKETLFLTSRSAPVVTWSMDDPECGISHFLVSVGSFPFQSDLLASQLVNSRSRSLDLQQENFIIYEGLTFYVTVTGVNMLGLETMVTSQQIVVDWTAPEFGNTVDGNRTWSTRDIFIHSDFQREKGMLFAQWSGIHDPESDVIGYQWCIGTAPGNCDVKNMTTTGSNTTASHSVASQQGFQYFITVVATNGAGLSQAIYSGSILADSSPPVLEEVHILSEIEQNGKPETMIQKHGKYLAFYWVSPYDKESGILSVTWCAGSSNSSCNIVPLTSVNQEHNSVKHYMSEPLVSGDVVFVMLEVTNGAGITTTVVAAPLLIDTTPPSVGDVTVGETAGRTAYFRKEDPVTAKWTGFLDGESRLSHFEWTVCQASTQDKCLCPYKNVGAKTTTNVDVLVSNYGVSYVVIVRAFNKAGLFSEAISNQFIVNGLAPSDGTVYDGLKTGRDIEFQSSTSQLSANWTPFTDANERIADYEMCAGTEPGSCDLRSFVSVGIKLAGTISGLSLTHNEVYFITVRATSETGYSTTTTSNGVRVDSTPPVTGVVRDGESLIDIDYQADDTYIYANWDEFQDDESDVTGYTCCAGTGKDICDIIPATFVGERTSISQQIMSPLPEGIAIYVTASALNNAGVSTMVSSDGFKVDNTGPIISMVLELQLDLNDNDDVDYLTAKDGYCVRWNVVDSESGVFKSYVSVCSEFNTNDCLLNSLDVGNQTSICVADLEFKEGIKYLTKIRAENFAGLSLELYADGFVVDSTPPSIGEITYIDSFSTMIGEATQHFTHSIIAVEWNGFWDKESGVLTSYVCVGTQPGRCNSKNVTNVGNSTTYTFQDFPLVQGETYFVSVKVENGAGLTSDVKTSDGIVVDRTGPTNGGVILDGNKDGEDVDIQSSRTLIAAHWGAFEDPESDLISLSWCSGIAPGNCDLVKGTQLDLSSTSVLMALTTPITNGQRYYVTVNATNGAGVTTSLISSGVTVDNTPPISGTVIDGLVLDVDYINGDDDISASWFDFSDQESGIKSYEVALCDARNLSSCPLVFTQVGQVTNVTIAGLDLETGAQYMFIVKAMNYAGIEIEAFSNGFTVDFTPPIEGKVWVGADNEYIIYQADPTKVVLSWTPFMDVESGITKYEVCLSSVLQNCTVTTFIDVGLNTSYTINGLHLTHGKTYYVILRVTNGIGLSSETTTPGVLIDLTSPTLKNNGFKSSFTRNQTESTDNHGNSLLTFTCSEEHLISQWEEFEDHESGMLKYQWCVGTAKALCDIVPMRSVGLQTRSAAIVKKLRSGTQLFSTVYVINGAKNRRQLISQPCTVITIAPKIVEVIDVSSNSTDIDWKSSTQSLSLRWTASGSYLDEIPCLYVQIAVTSLSSNRSLPHLIQEMSWNGEPLRQPFMNVQAWQRNITIHSVTLHPWKSYRGIVRVWNKGNIYSEACTDGLKIEPSHPPTRGLTIRDKAAEKEHLRWWPNLRIPPLNQSSVDSDIIYISSPADLELTINTGASNVTANKTDYILDHNMISPTAEFKLVVTRVTSGINDTNSTFESRTMKAIPGFADSESPCCTKQPSNIQSAFSDTHLKPTLPTEEFGVSLAMLSNDVVAIGCKSKVVLQSLKNKTATLSVALDDQSDPTARVKIASHHNRTGFLLNDQLYVYEGIPSDPGNTVLGKRIVIGNCKNVSTSDCPENEKWTDNLRHAFALSGNMVAVTGTNSTINKSVVAVFRENRGKWMFINVTGKEVKEPNFGHSLSLNERIMAIAAGDGNNSCVFVYSLPMLVLNMKICFTGSRDRVAPVSIHLTETDALVVLSRTSRLLKVFQLNDTSESYHVVCEYRAEKYIAGLSGNLDVNKRKEGFVIAIGIEVLNGGEGVQLLGFQGIYGNNSYPSKRPNECVNLGSLLARESGLRVDGKGTRTSVTFKGNSILFGIPGILTWPKSYHWLNTGRVYMATYCPLNHFRTSASGLRRLRPVKCAPCEKGRKSFGGFVETCSVCTGRMCPSPQYKKSSSFTSGICDDSACTSTTHLNNTTNGRNVHLKNGSLFAAGSEYVYTVELVETTRAGESTSSFSESFLIDATAPLAGVVYDGHGSDQNLNCSENSTFGEHSQCSTRSFEDTDITFTHNTQEIHARWIDFLDNESDIIEYFWCVGTQPSRDDIWVCESTGLRPNGSHYGLRLKQGDSYYVTVIACNGARMCSAAHSNGVTIDTTPPIMKYVRDGVMGPDMDFQVFLDIIFAYFAASDPDSGVTSYEVAWGTGPGSVDVSDFEEVINTTIWRAKIKDGALETGKKYFATVRATNGAGLLSDQLSSNGIVVGKSEYVFDNSSKASFFFDTVNVKEDGTRKDGGVGQTYGTLTVPEGAVEEEVKLRCYSLDKKTLEEKKTEEGPVSDPSKTGPKQFMLGNYSFQIKALDPVNNTVQEGFQFVKPIKLSMFYDVDKLVKANKKHVNDEVTKEEIDPVLYLWDPQNETWFDAAHTCPEPWSHVNRSFKLLEVNVCHLTQFAFFFSFYAQNGLIMFDKNHSMYDSNGDIQVLYVEKVTELEIPVRRSKGSQGNITVQWSLYENNSEDSLDLIWPTSGKLAMKDGQWNGSFILNINNRIKTPESVMWVQLENPTGGALLASRDKIIAKILIASNLSPHHGERTSVWVPVSIGTSVACVIALLGVFFGIYRCKKKKQRINPEEQREETEMPEMPQLRQAGYTAWGHSPGNSNNKMDETTFSTLTPVQSTEMTASNPVYDSICSPTSTNNADETTVSSNPLYDFTLSAIEEIGKVNYGKNDEQHGDDAMF